MDSVSSFYVFIRSDLFVLHLPGFAHPWSIPGEEGILQLGVDPWHPGAGEGEAEVPPHGAGVEEEEVEVELPGRQGPQAVQGVPLAVQGGGQGGGVVGGGAGQAGVGRDGRARLQDGGVEQTTALEEDEEEDKQEDIEEDRGIELD